MRVLGLDCSTKSAAWAIIDDGVLVSYGEYYFDGDNIYRRITDAQLKTQALLKEFEGIDYIVFEKVVRIMHNNIATSLSMAKVFGAIMGVLGQTKAIVFEVPPISWQEFIGNPNITGEKRRNFLIERPELKTKAQQSKTIREYRKNVTMKWAEKTFGVVTKSDNISDAVGVAYYGFKKMEEIHG